MSESGAVVPVHFTTRDSASDLSQATFHRSIRILLVLLTAAGLGFACLVGSRELYFHDHLRLARSEVELGHNAAASRHLSFCRVIHPDHPEVLLLYGAVARRSGAWEAAEDFFSAYSRKHGDDEALAFEWVLLRATRGELDSSGPLLIAKIEAGGLAAGLAREALVTGLLYRFRWLEAESHLRSWLASAPNDTHALLLRGKFLEQRNAVVEAIEVYRKVVTLDPDHDEARLRLTTLLLQQRLVEELLSNLEHLRRRLPDLPEVQVQYSKALALQGRTEEALAALEECLRQHPDYGPALAERGALAIRAGDDRAAEEFLERAVRLSPGEPIPLNQYVIVLERNGKAAEAAKQKAVLRQLEVDQERIRELVGGPLQTRPTDPSVPHEIAVIALRSGQASEGLRWLQAALQIDPNHGPTHQILANYYQTFGNPALAAKHRAMARQFGKRP